MAHAIVVNNLGHTFNGSQVLSQVSFHVELGEFFVIIGPNGSGKTTLLRLITGLMPLKQGEITDIDGEVTMLNFDAEGNPA